MPDVICANHKCQARFEAKWAGQVYCCTACRIKGRNFRKTHGERAINAAMDGRDPLPIIAAIVQILRPGG